MRSPIDRTFAAAGALAMIWAGPVSGVRALHAVEYIPIYSLNMMGGQYFFTGSKSSLNGNAVGNIAPVLKFNERWSLLPIYSVNYQGTKQVTDPVGSGTLFQQFMDHRVSAMGLYSSPASQWRLKPSAGYKVEFMKETRDEAWGRGLFDYHKAGVGFEAENVYKDPFSYRVSYDFYYVRFPNYVSLESKSGVDPFGNPLGRETAGTRVLDTFNHQVSLSATRPFPYDSPRVSLQAGYSALWQAFPDQPIINRKGQPNDHDPKKRQDFNQSLSLGVGYPRSLGGGAYQLNSRFGAGLNHNGSNQNTFDAARSVFVSNSYSYYGYSAGPGATLSWGDSKQPAWLSAGLTYSHTRYLGRLAQRSDGGYTSDRQNADRFLLSFGYGYPIAPHFSLKAQANFLWASSNMAYEATYRYAYRTANYLFGFTYDY